MIRENIDNMIFEARKERNQEKTLTYQAIKNEFLKYKTAKNAKPLTDEAEVTILKKMVKERTQSAEIYKEAGREDLEDKERKEISFLLPLLPTEPTEEDYLRILEDFINELGDKPFDKTQMGNAIKYIKSHLEGAEGKVASEIVNNKLSGGK